jgi:DNA polymerase III epsilon subunit-like protein
MYLGVDTETCNSLVDENEKLDLSNSLVYDVGWAIVDKYGKPYKTRSYVVEEIFYDSVLMDSAYYKEKIPQYLEDIEQGKRIVAPFNKIRMILLSDRKKWNCKAVFAHNAYFDYNALNVTARYLTGSKVRYFFPYKVDIWDTLRMSRNTIGKTEKYSKYCMENGYLTNHKTPQNRLTAEILYRYIKNDPHFIESHTGLEDVEIEKDIFAYCMKKGDRKTRRSLFTRNCPE